MSRKFAPAIEDALDWVASELPEDLRNFNYAQNYYKHRSNLADAVETLGDRKGNILELGCGIGVFSAAIARLGQNVTALDLVVNKWLPDHGIETVACDILTEPFPFPDASFDLVTMFDIIEHLHGSPRHALSEVFRVLRPGGYIIVETPNIANLRRRLVLLFGKNPMPIKYFYESPYPFAGHVYEYTGSDLENAIQWSGFEITRSGYSNLLRMCHKTANGYAPGLKLQGPEDVAMFAYLAICKVFPFFKELLICIGRRP